MSKKYYVEIEYTTHAFKHYYIDADTQEQALERAWENFDDDVTNVDESSLYRVEEVDDE